MKRSEMIEFLAEQLFYRDLAAQHQFWYNEEDRPLLNDDVNKDMYYGDAKTLLYKIENLGMLPPYVKIHPDNWLTKEQITFLDRCEWEDENDKSGAV